MNSLGIFTKLTIKTAQESIDKKGKATEAASPVRNTFDGS
jgi:hypothetical protein